MPAMIWSALEGVRGGAALEVVWRRHVGDAFPVFRRAFLRRRSELARYYPCPRGCGCQLHRVVRHGADDYVAVCQCEPWACDDIVLKHADLVVYELDAAALGRAVVRALGVHSRESELPGLPGTRQIGAYTEAAIPVLLSVRHDRDAFRRTATELVARLGGGFVLVTPSLRLVDAPAQEILRHAKAVLLPLEGTMFLLPEGALRTVRPAGELLKVLAPPAAAPLPEDVALQAFRLVQTLDDERPMKAPTLLTVFRLYCMRGLPAGRIAATCRVSKATVINRMALLRERLGRDLDEFRAYSPQFEKLESDIAESKAAFVSRKGLIYGDRAFDDDAPDQN